jgi:DNA processing protein
MDRAELQAWLRLMLTPRVGLLSARKLLAALGSPQAVFTAPLDALASVVSMREAKALQTEPEQLAERVDLSLAWLNEPDPVGASRAILSLADPRYPSALLEVADPPLLLFAQGQLSWLQAPAVAMVGSRNPTPQGRDNALAFAQSLSLAGLTVISGLADGVDGAAHEGALAGLAQGGSGSTIAVVGTGLDRVYPAKHHALARQIAQQGLLLSEFAVGTPPLSANFPKRNRIVAGLSKGTLVVEAALQSGSLITARLAAEMGREVMAIPGSIHAPQSKGAHALIKQGASLIETAQDVLDALHWGSAQAAAKPVVSGDDLADASARSPEDSLLEVMGYDPVSQDALSARTGLGAAELGARLLMLELDGLVARLPGQLFQRSARA